MSAAALCDSDNVFDRDVCQFQPSSCMCPDWATCTCDDQLYYGAHEDSRELAAWFVTALREFRDIFSGPPPPGDAELAVLYRLGHFLSLHAEAPPTAAKKAERRRAHAEAVARARVSSEEVPCAAKGEGLVAWFAKTLQRDGGAQFFLRVPGECSTVDRALISIGRVLSSECWTVRLLVPRLWLWRRQ
eukprot:m51a1_g14234 hypothetical protein (188) ;mRNA; f:221321-222236